MALNITSLEPVATSPVASRWRRIVTPIPAPQSVSLIERLRRAEPQSMSGMPPVLWHQAEGFLVRDPYGNQWIDLTSGIVLANAGHAHPRIVAAIRESIDQRLLATYAFPAESRLKLLERLVSLAPMPDPKAILFSSGTEATECALMLMRRHGQRIHRDKVGILSLAGNYHGRTLAAQLAGGKPTGTDWIERDQVRHFQIPAPDCLHCPWGKPAYENCGADCFHSGLLSLSDHGVDHRQIAGLILEPVPGWTTAPIPADFARAAVEWARQHQVMVAFDEIQCGCGRTGKFFGGEHLGISPDLLVLGKGLSSSLPVSAVIGRREILDQPQPGDMSSTHGGNPVCAAAALAEEDFFEFAVAAAEAAPEVGLIVYNTYWTSVGVSASLIGRLVEIPNLVGLKWATPNPVWMTFEDALVKYSQRLGIIDNQSRFVTSHMLGARAIELHICNHWPQFGVRLWQLLEAKQYEEAQREMVRVLQPYMQLWAEMEKYTSGDGYLDKLCVELVGLDSSRCRPPTRDVRDTFREQARKMLVDCGTPNVELK